MLGSQENRIKAKVCLMSIKVFDDAGHYIRTVTEAKTDVFAEDAEVIDADKACKDGIIPIHIAGVETPWTEGDGETTFIWDCKNENGSRVEPGVFNIEISQTDKYGNNHKLVKTLRIS